jgi:hypothetical protein
VAERTSVQVRRLISDALGPASAVPDLAATVFLALRGFVVSQQLLDTMAYDAVPPRTDRTARQRRLMSQVVTPYVEQATPAAAR